MQLHTSLKEDWLKVVRLSGFFGRTERLFEVWSSHFKWFERKSDIVLQYDIVLHVRSSYQEPVDQSFWSSLSHLISPKFVNFLTGTPKSDHHLRFARNGVNILCVNAFAINVH